MKKKQIVKSVPQEVQEVVEEQVIPQNIQDSIDMLNVLDSGKTVQGKLFYSTVNGILNTSYKYTDCTPCNIDIINKLKEYLNNNHNQSFIKTIRLT